MYLRTWQRTWRWIISSASQSRPVAGRYQSRYFQPRFERLEERLALSAVSLAPVLTNPLAPPPMAYSSASSSSALAATVFASTTSITVTAGPGSEQVTLTASVSGFDPDTTNDVYPQPGELVAFYLDYGTVNQEFLGNGVLDSVGNTAPLVVTLDIHVTSSHTITAVYGQQNNYLTESQSGPVTIEVTCVGTPAGGVGILLLNKCGTSLSALSSGNVTVTGGDIFANSKGPTTAVIKGNGNVTANEIDVHGLYDAPGGGTAIGTIDMDDPPMADPLASLAIPAMGVTRSTSTKYISSGNVTLQPGRYIGGIVISGNANVTLAPGIYYLDGGGFTVTGKANVTGDGVMLYNAAKKSWCGYTGGDITFSTSGTVRLTAMSSGPYQGIVIFQDRRLTNTVTQSGSGSVFLTGKLYAAAATVKVNGNGDLVLRSDASKGITAQLVASKLVVTNMSTYSKCYRKVTPSTGGVLVDLGEGGMVCTVSVVGTGQG